MTQSDGDALEGLSGHCVADPKTTDENNIEIFIIKNAMICKIFFMMTSSFNNDEYNGLL